MIRFEPVSDFVLSFAAARRIREAHPRARITLLTSPQFEALAKTCPYFNEVDADGALAGLGDQMRVASRIRQGEFHQVYDLQTSGRTNLLFQFLRPSPPAWSGTAIGCSLPHRNRRREQMHPLERQADQLKAAGIWPDAPVEPGTAPGPDVSWVRSDAAPTGSEGAAGRPCAVLAPGGTSKAERVWPIENYQALANTLRKRGFDIVVLGRPEDSALGRAIQRTVGAARDLTGRSDLVRIARLGARGALAVGNRSGAMHLLAAAGAPSVVLYAGGSDPALTAPRGRVKVLQAPELKDLPVAQVAQAAQALLRSA
ncbi:MAG TPA: glycosyltransferase family 9 protein [Caulobacteraceae bacterium]